MPFTGNESQPIDLALAATMTSKYRQAPVYTSTNNQTKAYFFGKNKIQEVLDQRDCVGIRAYFAMNNNGIMQLVLVGTRASEDDMVEGIILDMAVPCPNTCGVTNPLQFVEDDTDPEGNK